MSAAVVPLPLELLPEPEEPLSVPEPESLLLPSAEPVVVAVVVLSSPPVVASKSSLSNAQMLCTPVSAMHRISSGQVCPSLQSNTHAIAPPGRAAAQAGSASPDIGAAQQSQRSSQGRKQVPQAGSTVELVRQDASSLPQATALRLMQSPNWPASGSPQAEPAVGGGDSVVASAVLPESPDVVASGLVAESVAVPGAAPASPSAVQARSPKP